MNTKELIAGFVRNIAGEMNAAIAARLSKLRADELAAKMMVQAMAALRAIARFHQPKFPISFCEAGTKSAVNKIASTNA